MKHCPHCAAGYHDSLVTCPTHGGVLSEIRELKPGMVIHKTYRIARKLGKGGMGVVYLADQVYIQQPRALKFLSTDLCEDEAFTNRFRTEVQALRQVRHKNVVDCGDLEPAEDDSLFFAMEFVDGPDLRDFLNDLKQKHQPMDVGLALEITRGIAEGLGAAHALGMVHRDIKPENILLAKSGDTWLPKIADFGIVASKESSYTRTKTGGTLLTMAYAAPEQWRGTRAAKPDGRADLYALGGVLYEMLTGQTAFHAENYEDWMDHHRNTAPKPPSALRPELKHWHGLDPLVLYLLAKDRENRPQDVSQFLSLLPSVRYVSPNANDKTVVEKPPVVRVDPTLRERISRRDSPQSAHRWWWAVACLLFLVAAFAVWRAFTPKPGPSNNQALDMPQPTPTSQPPTSRKATVPNNPAQTSPAPAQVQPATAQVESQPVPRQIEPQPIAPPPSAGGPLLRTIQGGGGNVFSVAYSPDGRTLAAGNLDKTIKLWDVATGQQLRTFAGHGNFVDSVAFSPDGRLLASSGSFDKTVKLWDVASGRLLSTLTGHTDYVRSVAFSPDGRTLVSGSSDYTARLWDVSSGRTLQVLKGHNRNVEAVAFSPDGRIVATGSTDSTIRFWDSGSGQLLRILEGHSDTVSTIGFSPDGRTLASGSDDKTVRLWDVASGQSIRTLEGFGSYVFSVAFSPDGRTLATGDDGKNIKLWDVATGQLLRTFRGHSYNIWSVAFSPDGRTLASGSADATIKFWDVSNLR